MNAATKDAVIPQVVALALAAIAPPKYQPRQTFDEAKMKDLQASIGHEGVLVPVIVRPHPNGKAEHYELVAGERRFRASKALKLHAIPAQVRDLTDAQVLSVQLIENKQRDDVHPIEEAEAFERLLAMPKPDGTARTVKEIANDVGFSPAHVLGRIKLCSLCPDARKAFLAGKLDATKALLIARLAHPETQRRALKDILGGEHGDRVMSAKEAAAHILRTYLLKLSEAPFDVKDVTLVAGVGDCAGCPKRTGNQKDLFGDVKDADICTDAGCFDDKRQAHHAKAAIEKEAAGRKVMYGDAAKKVFPEWDSTHNYSRDQLAAQFVPLEATVWHGSRNVEVRKVMGADYEAPLVQHPMTGKFYEIVPRQAFENAVKKSKPEKAKTIGGSGSVASKPKGPDVDDMLTERLAQMMLKRAPKQFARSWYVELASLVGQHLNTRDIEAVRLAWGWKTGEFKGSSYSYSRGLPKAAEKLNERDLVLLMFQMIFALGAYSREPVLKLFGIKEKEVRETILEERKAAAKKAREDAKAAKAKPKAKAKAKPKK